MIKRHCSDPTVLDNIVFDYNNVHVIQTYNPNSEILNNFRNISKKIVVLVYLGDYHNYEWLEEILSNSKNYFLETGKLKNYYILLSIHEYPKQLFIEYSDFFTVIYEPCLYNYYTDHFEKITVNKNIKYHFLSLNNRASTARQSLYYFFNKFNLLSKSYFSYLGDLQRTIHNSHEEITKIIAPEKIAEPWFIKNCNYKELNKKIPVKIINDNFFKNDWSAGQEKYYNETFCSLVFETFDDQEFPFLTEKTWKPIAFGHPFIVYSNNNSLKQLQDLGFKTFGDFWDEDYDLLAGNQRLESIFHLILEIANWPLEKLNLIYDKILPVIEHNQNHFFNNLPKMYENVKPDIIKKISNIIEEKNYIV